MGKRISLSEAVKATGLTEYSLRLAVRQGKVPFIRSGWGNGKILFDLDQLEVALQEMAISNMEANRPDSKMNTYGGIRAL